MKLFDIQKDIIYTQTKNCLFCVHIFTVAFYVLIGFKNVFRLELLTLLHKFRLS